MRSPHEHISRTLLLTLALSSAAGLLVTPLMLGRRHNAPPPSAVAVAPTRASGAQALETYGRIPLSFEPNQGQAESSVDFVARGGGYALFIKPTETVFVLRNEGSAAEHSLTADAPQPKANPQSKVLRMKLVGAAASAAAVGAEELAGKVNYFVGEDPALWRTNVPTFGRVSYAEVYEGVDVVYYGNQRQLEYDFRVAAGADPRAVALQFEGADKVEVDAAGDLLLTLGESVIRQPKPVIYQEVAGARQTIEGGYAVAEGGRVGFSVGEYDRGATLVIDPTIAYSTYLGGSDFEDGSDIRVDSAGSAYICGITNSTNFPTANAIQSTFSPPTDPTLVSRDAFVTKLNAAGNAFVYSTYLGGGGDDRCNKITVDSTGNAYLAGETTSSSNFPRANALQNTFGGGLSDAFITKLNPAGNALVYSTYLGGNVFDAAVGIALDSSNNVYLTGRTTSPNFPTANAIQATQAGIFADAFVTKINAAGNALVYSTYLGGSDGDQGGFENGFSIAVDSTGAAYVAGQTRSTNFPTASPIQATFGGGFPDGDAFVTKLNPAGNALVYSTYLGGTDNDIAFEIAVDSAGSAYVAGVARANFPTANAFQNALRGPSDAFLTKFSPAGTSFVYSTYFGGTGDDSANGIAVNAGNEPYLAIGTSSGDLPTANPTQAASGGGIDAAVTRFNAAGNALIYSTYLGGGGLDAGLSIALDSADSMYLVGRTASTNFPTATPVQGTYGGGQDAFVTKLAQDVAPASTFQFSQAAYVVQEDETFVNFSVTRIGDTSAAATVDYATADGTATERSDYTTALGTLRFAAGQTEVSVPLLINEDSFVEGPHAFTVSLSNPTGPASLGAIPTATVQITDDAVESTTNVIDDANIFVGQQYHDFLNRQADASGLAFWSGQITACGSDAACIDRARANVSQAFFLSIEFQQTGFLVFRFYKESFTDSTGRPRGMPRYREFLRDTQEIGRGVVVGVGNWEQQLEANKQAFARQWVQRPEFVAQFPQGSSTQTYVGRLFGNAEVTPTTAEFTAAANAYGPGDTEGRAAALRSVAESGSVYNRQFNPAFVLAQYIGYLRRNPNDSPEAGLNYAGFDFWLAKMDSFSQPGEDVRNEGTAIGRANRAEMVRAFIISTEYRGRFGQP